MNTLVLFIATALAEIVGCYLPYLWLKQGKSLRCAERQRPPTQESRSTTGDGAECERSARRVS